MNRLGSTPNDSDLILAYLQDENPNAALPDKLKLKLKMMEWAYSEIRTHKKPSKVANMLMKHFSIGKSTALVVIREMELVFGTVDRKDKEFWRNMIVESLWELIGKAKNADDWKAAGMLFDKLIKAQGLDRDNEDGKDKPLRPYNMQQIVFMPNSFGVPDGDGNVEKKLKEFLKQIGKDEPVEEIVIPDVTDESGE